MSTITFKTSYRVIYGDTDTMGIVYYGNYLRWFEIGRNEFFRQAGIPYKSVEEQGVIMPVSEVQCKYISPCQYDDMLVIRTSIDIPFKAAIQVNYHIMDEYEGKTHAIGFTRHACMNQQGKVIRPPLFVRNRLEQIAKDHERTYC